MEIFRSATGQFKKSDDQREYASALDQLSKSLASSETLRAELGQSEDVWKSLTEFWSSAEQLDLDDEAASGLLLSFTKFNRNLVGGNVSNQNRSFPNLLPICGLIRHLTSFGLINDSKTLPLLRMMLQLVANNLTLNEQLVDRFWGPFVQLDEDNSFLVRSNQSKDIGVSTVVFILVRNCLHASPIQISSYFSSSTGRKLALSLLDKIDTLSESEHDTPEDRAFDIGYRIFEQLFQLHSTHALWKSLAASGEPVTPAQIILIKLLDVFLQDFPPSFSPSTELNFLIPEFCHICVYTEAIMQDALRTGSDSVVDSSLSLVYQALVLLCQCILSVVLKEQEKPGSDPLTQQAKTDVPFEGKGLPETIIALLRQLDLFLPRVMHGKPLPTVRLENAHSDPSGFAYVKRDLVRLLGALVYEDKPIQDRVRECDGIPVVMNLCVTDERNPYLREHALFTLRNLLHKNVENQKVVDSIRPSGTWDEEGVLRDVPGAIRK
ncbi:hypothetical protein SISSUDRAFT_1062424 [Sistotremastrum suecicum HHB10207 ss-3]|uniref:Ataxin-10 homolog n=1 Tax=Sistotremastrum suecicum HHB10207 ss-3 TaxID=1314776 RepID=A0A166CY30_9AGAM|nr:hypothetical protein SISSUDRAFT_1062424 [Sistotremastrum suecicum HHB10207 ss-3]